MFADSSTDARNTFFKYKNKGACITVTSHLSPVTCHLPPFTSHLSPVTCHLSPVTSHLSSVTCHLSHVSCHLSPVTCHLLPVTSNLSPLTRFPVDWRLLVEECIANIGIPLNFSWLFLFQYIFFFSFGN